MTEPVDRRTRIAEAAAAAALFLWRILAQILAHPPQPIYRDWIAILAIYWLITIATQRTRAWPWLTAGFMVLLGLIYLQGQFPHTLATLRMGS